MTRGTCVRQTLVRSVNRTCHVVNDANARVFLFLGFMNLNGPVPRGKNTRREFRAKLHSRRPLFSLRAGLHERAVVT